jgi:pimeloyl-ACP methyl ester carboxylesterase
VVNAAVPSAWRSGRVRASGVTLATYETGSDASGARVVLLLHGLGHWTDGAWGRLVPHLDPSLRYVAFDLPGFGASEKPDAPYDAAYFRRVMHDAVTALGLQHFALVGHSLGGFIAADYAGEHPERVTHLALIAPAGFSRTPRHLFYGLAGALARGLLASAPGHDLFARGPSRRFIARIFERGVVDASSLDPAHVERAYELSQELALRKAFAGVYAGALRTFAMRRRVHADLARYLGPVLCAWGKHDRYIGIAALREVRRIYPQATTLVLDRSGHLPTLEEPEKLGAALRVFLGSV